MKRTPIKSIPEVVPHSLHTFIRDAQIYDSSCSPTARVYYIDKEGGCFLKSAPKGTLRQEAAMTRYFHGKGLSPEVLTYASAERDWLLTARIPGEDCTHEVYLADPVRLCDTTAELLRQLHDLPAPDCPFVHTSAYLARAQKNYRAGQFDTSLFGDRCPFSTAEEAWNTLQNALPHFRADILLHGDYCLPNILLTNWSFSGFIDVGGGGQGDRHIDIFWGIWSLCFNLKTDRYASRFLDAYGRDAAEPEMLRAVAALETFG